MTRRNSDQLARSRDLKLAPPGKRPGLSSSAYTWTGTCSQSVGQTWGHICWPGPWLVCLESSPVLLLLMRQGAPDSSVIPCPPSPPISSLHVGRPGYHTPCPFILAWLPCMTGALKCFQAPSVSSSWCRNCAEMSRSRARGKLPLDGTWLL